MMGLVNIVVDSIQTVAIASTLYWIWTLNKRLDVAQGLISQETIRKAAHTKAFEKLTNPDVILEEMEHTAKLHEAYETERNKTLSRDDQKGPSAQIFRPKTVRKTFSQRPLFPGNPPRKRDEEI